MTYSERTFCETTGNLLWHTTGFNWIKTLLTLFKFWSPVLMFFFFSPSFTQTVGKGAVNKLTLCNGSTSGSSDCEIMKESPSTFSRGFHFPHTYVVFLCVSLGSALLVSSAFIMSYYYCNVRKRVAVDEEDDDIPRGDWSRAAKRGKSALIDERTFLCQFSLSRRER